MAQGKKISVETNPRDPRKKVVKFSLEDEAKGISGAFYLTNTQDKKLGSPETLSIVATAVVEE